MSRNRRFYWFREIDNLFLKIIVVYDMNHFPQKIHFPKKQFSFLNI